MLSVVKMLPKGEVGGCSLNSHGNYIVDHGKSWKNHGIVFLNLCGNPVHRSHIYIMFYSYSQGANCLYIGFQLFILYQSTR